MSKITMVRLEADEVKLVVRALQQLRVYGLTDRDDALAENLIDYVETQAES